MEITEAVGFIQFWGMTPPINFLEDQECKPPAMVVRFT